MISGPCSILSRHQVRSIGLSATTLGEIRYARQILLAWQEAHPEEPKMADVFEQLYIMEDAQCILAAQSDEEAA